VGEEVFVVVDSAVEVSLEVLVEVHLEDLPEALE
jgi:hypothetical protein